MFKDGDGVGGGTCESPWACKWAQETLSAKWSLSLELFPIFPQDTSSDVNQLEQRSSFPTFYDKSSQNTPVKSDAHVAGPFLVLLLT